MEDSTGARPQDGHTQWYQVPGTSISLVRMVLKFAHEELPLQVQTRKLQKSEKWFLGKEMGNTAKENLPSNISR